MKTKAVVIGILWITFLLSANGVANAQSAGTPNPKVQDKKEKVDAMKVAFLSDKLNLTPVEAEKFWPLYNEFKDRREALRKANNPKLKALKDIKAENLTEDQADELINSELTQEQNLLDLKKEYYPKFKKVIGSKKVVALFMAEKDFNKVLLDRLKDGNPKPKSDE